MPNSSTPVVVRSLGSVTIDSPGAAAQSLTIGTVPEIGHIFNARERVTINGTGSLTVEGNTAIGAVLGVRSELVVSGPSARLTTGTIADRTLSIGLDGAGFLLLSAGGQVESNIGNVGAKAGSSGRVSIDGAGSRWNASSIGLGSSGYGLITVSNGGSFSTAKRLFLGFGTTANEIRLGGQSGGFGEINVGAGPGTTAGFIDSANIHGGSGTAVLNFIHDDPTHYFTRNGAASGAGVGITGSTQVNHLGDGRTIFTSDLSYTGGTIIEAGTLQIGAGGTTGRILGNVTNDGALVFDRSDTFTFPGVISGTGTLAQNGTGTLILTANHPLTGTTTINAGTLQLGNGGTTGSVAGNIVTHGTLALHRSDNLVFANAISGSGGFTKLGANTVTFTGDHTFTGPTTISAGTLSLGSGGTTGSVAGDIVNHGSLVLNRSDALVFANAISGSGSLTKLGSNDLTLNGNNTFTGTTTMQGGTLRLGNGGTSGGLVGNIATNGAVIVNRSNALTLPGTLSGNGTLTKLGAGTLTLTANNTFTGLTTISGGTLQLGDGGTSGSVSGAIVNSGALIFNRSNAATYGGVISGTGSIAKRGPGTLTLSGDNTYTGATSLHAGTLVVTGSLTSPTTLFVGRERGDNATLLISDGGTVTNARGEIGSLAPFTTPASIGAATVTGAGSAWHNTGNLVVGFAGEGSLTVSAGGTVTSASSFIGTTIASTGSATVTGAGSSWTVNGGLRIGDEGTGTLTVSAGGSVTNTSAIVGRGFARSGAVTVTGNGSSWTSSGQVVLGENTSGSLTLINRANASAASFLLGQNSSGSGTLTLGTGSGYGVLTTGYLERGAGSATINFDGVTLRASGHEPNFTRNFTPGQLTLTSAVLFDTAGFDVGASAPFGGPGVFAKLGSGTLTLSGASTYTGGTTIRGGTLAIAADAALGATTGGLTLNGGTLATSATFALHANRSITLGTNGATFAPAATTTLTLAGPVSGTGALINAGSGTLTLAGASTYTGDTYVRDGTLRITGSVNSPGAFIGVGQLTNNHGALTISDGGSLTSHTSRIGEGLNSTGVVTVTGTGSSWHNSFVRYVGSHGTGTLLVSDGGSVSGGSIFVGIGPSGSDSVTVRDSGSTLDANLLELGFGTTGTFTVSHGATATSLNALLGATSDGSGTATVTGSGSRWDTRFIFVGSPGASGDLRVLDGGHIEAEGMALEGGNASSTIDGPGSRLNSELVFLGGESATSATLTVANGGTLTSVNAISLGYAVGGTSTINIGSGAGAGHVSAPGIHGGPGAATVNFNHTDADHHFTANGTATGTAIALTGALEVHHLGSGTTTFAAASTYTGDTTITAGRIQIANTAGSAFGSGDVTVAAGATLGGTGAFTGSLTVAPGGTLAPGNSPGLIQIGGDATFAGTIEIELGGLTRGITYDAFDVGGTLHLGGELTVSMLADFAPAFGDSFQIFAFDSIVGSFALVNLPTIAPGLTWNTDSLLSDGTLSVIPEPSVFAAIIGLATLALAYTRRRRR